MFDPYHKWLGIHKKYRPLTLYRLLGIDPAETDIEVIEEAAIRQISHLRAYQSGEHADVCARVMEEIAKAREILTTPEKRRAYDAKLARLRKKPTAPVKGNQGNNAPPNVTPGLTNSQVESAEPSPFADLFEQNVVVAPTVAAATPQITSEVLPKIEVAKSQSPSKKGMPIGLIGGGVGVLLVLGIVLGVMLLPKGNGSDGPNGGGLDGEITLTTKVTAKGVVLDWNQIPSAKFYEVQRGKSEKGPWATIANQHKFSQFIDNGGVGVVCYRIRANDGDTWGEWSNSSSIDVGDKSLLDRVPGALAAYSLRKLANEFSGPAIRVRRSSDDKEMDIGFAGKKIDTKSLLKFVENGDGFVAKWYDQSGNNNNAIQSKLTSQPKIVENGYVIEENDSGTLLFDGVDDHLVTEHSKKVLSKFTIIGVFNINNEKAGTMFDWRNSAVDFPLIDDNNTGGLSLRARNDEAQLRGIPPLGRRMYQQIGIYRWDGSSIYLHLLNEEVVSVLFSGMVTVDRIAISSNGRNLGANPVEGRIQEFLFYPSDRGSDRSIIESDINTYYKILP